MENVNVNNTTAEEEIAASKQKETANDNSEPTVAEQAETTGSTQEVEETEGEQTEQQTEGTLSSLFAEEQSAEVSNRGNQLTATADLTRVSTMAVRDLLAKIDQDPSMVDAVAASKKSHDAMDDLIGDHLNVGGLPLDFLDDLSEDELEKMLRSQQSKRSRAKAKEPMTIESYRTMMIAAVCELALRLKLKKPKNYGGTSLGDLGLSEEDWNAYTTDAEELKKAIRNVQSKKSIMKSKADFDPQSARWRQLLELEEKLKSLRSNGSQAIPEEVQQELEAKREAEALLQEIDPSNLSEEDAKALIENLKHMMATRD